MSAKTAAVATVTVPMKLERETKGTYVFKTDAEDAAITQLYIRKAGFPDGAPESITVTVTA